MLIRTYLQEEINILKKVPGNASSKLNRLARAEMKLSEILRKGCDVEGAEKMKENALKHYSEATGRIVGGGTSIDFNRLVPYIDR